MISMTAKYAEAEPAERVVARFLREYHRIWQSCFPGLIRRTHWHVIFSARSSFPEGAPCRSIHRTLYGLYGTDIRTCIERIRDCERDGLIRVTDAAGQPCSASPGCLITATDLLRDSFDRHCRDTLAEIRAVFDGSRRHWPTTENCDDGVISAIFNFFNASDQKWRETCERVIRQKGLSPAYANDAMDHLVTYQYWAVVMLLWTASPLGSDHADGPALVIDEINSRMWDVLKLGHLAIKERVEHLIRWGFFTEQTIKKHKAVGLTPEAGSAISKGLADTKPLLAELYAKLAPRHAGLASA